MLNLYFIKIWWILLYVLRKWNFKQFYDLFLASSNQLLTSTFVFFVISTSFKQIFPLVVEAFDSKHRLKVPFFLRLELHWNHKHIFYFCLPSLILLMANYPETTVFCLTQTHSCDLYESFRIGIIKFNYLKRSFVRTCSKRYWLYWIRRYSCAFNLE
jgi:hypothetical protein